LLIVKLSIRLKSYLGRDKSIKDITSLFNILLNSLSIS